MTDQVAAASPAAEELQPTTVETPTVAQATSDVKPDTADTSTASGAKESTLFDAVKASLIPSDTKEAPPASDAKPNSETEAKPEVEGEEDDAEDKGDLSEEEKKALSAKTQKRIVKLARQRDDLKPFAERTRQMDAYMQTNGISREDAIGAFEVMSLMRSNPSEALKRLREISYQLSLSIGETIPQDIQAKIDAGTIDEATGRELAIARAKADGFKAATETLSARSAQDQERQTKEAISRDVSAWEASVTTRDADFAAKKPLIETHFRALLQAGEKLQSPADAVRLMKKAYEQTNASFKAIRPSTRTEVRTTSATATAATTTAPKTMDEAIRSSFAA